MELTHEQENLLKDLLGNQAWISLLKELEIHEVKPWKPGKDDNEEAKRLKWVFESGIQRGISRTLTILRLNMTNRGNYYERPRRDSEQSVRSRAERL